MSRELHIFDSSDFTNYAEAVKYNAIYEYDVSHADGSDNLKEGLLYEAILAMTTALKCIRSDKSLAFALVVDGHVVDFWR